MTFRTGQKRIMTPPSAEKMARLTAELHTQFAESARLEGIIRQNLEKLGYD